MLACTDCGSARVDVSEGEWNADNLEEGALACPECCRVFPVVEGIARMLPASLSGAAPASTVTSETALKLSEMEARDSQVADYDRMWHLNLFGLVEIPAMLRHMRLAGDHSLLEAGCGTGRMTLEFARRCRHQVSVDFSWESLVVCRRKLAGAGISHVDLVQADICRLPFRDAVFDRVVSAQVLEHIPTPDARELAVAQLGRVLKAGGNLVLSAYQYSVLMRLFGEKEGQHAGGIYFFRFTRRELRALLARHLRVDGITGALVYHYIARCQKV